MRLLANLAAFVPEEVMQADEGLAILAVGLLLLSLTTALASTLPRLGLYLDQLGMPRIPSLLDLFNQHLLSPIVSYATFTLFYKFLPATPVS